MAMNGPLPHPPGEGGTTMEAHFIRRGFLPEEDPLGRFGDHSEFAALDTLGHDLPSLLHDRGFRKYARERRIPALPDRELPLSMLRLYYVRLGFLASAYVNQVGEEPATLLPRNLAVPLCDVCARLRRPPILSYDGYALYNWRRFDPGGPIALGNIDTIQDFVHLYDEHWFILVHVQIEALAAGLLAAIARVEEALSRGDRSSIDVAMDAIARTIWAQVEVLGRIPEKMDPALYYRTFRPYIRFFEGVVYEGVDAAPLDFRGETGAQSSVVPTLVAFLKIPHRPSRLTDHLADMRRFMPAEHRALIERVEAMPDVRGLADKATYNEALEALATFRETHLGFARDYIARWVSDPRGTGGTPYLEWLGQLIAETRAHKIK
jgi:indoleamine 2,3-dioxygenase